MNYPVFITVTCDASDGTGCGMSWLEEYGVSDVIEDCPRCGKKAYPGHVVVNSAGAPSVKGLFDVGVLVVFEERVYGRVV